MKTYPKFAKSGSPFGTLSFMGTADTVFADLHLNDVIAEAAMWKFGHMANMLASTHVWSFVMVEIYNSAKRVGIKTKQFPCAIGIFLKFCMLAKI